MSAAPWFILIAFLNVTFLSLNKPHSQSQLSISPFSSRCLIHLNLSLHRDVGRPV